jgi:Trypsin
MRPSPLTRALALCLPLLLSACGPAPVQDGGPEEGPPTGESGQEMINGTRVSPAWAVLLDSYGANDEKWQCTGTLIAPRVVLTAATCLFHRGVKDLRQVVTAPYAGGVVQQAARAILHPTFTGDFVSQYNVGLVILDTPINLGSYPLVGFRAQPVGTNIRNIGRTLNGGLTENNIYQGPATPLQPGPVGYPFTDRTSFSARFHEYTDAGGAVLRADSTAPVVVAVNVGYTTDLSNQVWQTMARVDVVEPWIAEQLVLHGGVQPWIGYGITARSTAAFSVKVNFQPAGSPVPAGFVADSGQLYATRANGYRYGWAEDMTADTRDRNSALSPSQEFDTLLLMQKNGKNGMWQIAAPPGVYNVRMVAGDPSYIDSVYNMRFGTLEIFAFQPTEQNHWADRTMEGFFHYGGLLQLENVYGTDLNNKIAFVELTRTGPLP